MVKKKIKEAAKKPDIVITSVEVFIAWIKDNPKPVFIGSAVLVAIVGLFFGFRVYENRKDERTQYLLAQGLRSYQEFALAGQQDSLKKAETTFRDLLRENSKGVNDIVRLYLGKISRAQNRPDDARFYYTKVTQGASDSIVKRFASNALKELDTSK